MLLPPRYSLNKVRTMLVALVDAHNEKYRERIWPEVSDGGDVVNVQLTIGGRRPLRFSQFLLYKHAEDTDWVRSRLQEWIDEARALSSREQQRRSDGLLPPPKPRPRKGTALRVVR